MTIYSLDKFQTSRSPLGRSRVMSFKCYLWSWLVEINRYTTQTPAHAQSATIFRTTKVKASILTSYRPWIRNKMLYFAVLENQLGLQHSLSFKLSSFLSRVRMRSCAGCDNITIVISSSRLSHCMKHPSIVSKRLNKSSTFFHFPYWPKAASKNSEGVILNPQNWLVFATHD